LILFLPLYLFPRFISSRPPSSRVYLD
jgi:hypothetical protein